MHRLPSFVPLMALVTLAYLTLEIPFSVHLVKVLGGSPTQTDIDNIEDFGRILTGLAVSIWIIGSWVFPKGHEKRRPLVNSVVFAAAISVVATWSTYRALDYIAEATGDFSSAETRRDAFRANLAKSALGANGSGDLLVSDSNDWNTFISVAPVLTAPGMIGNIAGSDLRPLAEAEARRIMGTAEQFRDTFFGPAYDPIRGAYLDYFDANLRRQNTIDGISADADMQWKNYQYHLRLRRVQSNRYSASTANRIRKEVRDGGVPVPNNWHPNDEAGFKRAYASAARGKIDSAYKDGITRNAGAYIEPGLDSLQFMKHPVVQKKVRSELGLPSGSTVIVATMSDAEFASAVYAPKIVSLTGDLTDAFNAPVDEFSNGGRYEEFGIGAVKATRLPAMAILLSIAGAVLHIFKFTGYVAWMLAYRGKIRGTKNRRLRRISAAAVTASLFGYMFMAGNAITGTSTFGEIRGTGVYPSLLEGAIAIQPTFSVIGTTMELGLWQFVSEKMPAPVTPAFAVTPPPVLEASTSNTNGYFVLPEQGAPIPLFRPSTD